MNSKLLSGQQIMKSMLRQKWLAVCLTTVAPTMFVPDVGAQKVEQQAPSALRTESPVMKTYTFKTLPNGEELQADVFGASERESRPVMLNIHGGALMMGDR